MKKIASFLTLCACGTSAICAQTFFSVNAGTDGFNFNVTNVAPLFPPVYVAPAPPPPRVYAPLMPGVSYDDYRYTRKAYKKAAKRYRKAMKHAAEALPVMLFTAPGAVYYTDFDDDDYEDYYRHVRHHYKKHKKHHKHHKHHHHHDDDDDD